ncbi:MAG: hypothetical protein Q7V88_11060 [Actinomycetota bacterium]|nr:hypothetical protein [Actinomycetota bacterium]
MTRLFRPLAVALVGLCSLAAGCGGQNPYQATEAANNATVPTTLDISGTDTGSATDTGNATDTGSATDEGLGNNVFLPERENASDCFGAVERPNCGAKSKGGWHMYLTFAVLIGGLGFVGFRVAVGIRRRDAVVNDVGPRAVSH